MILFNDFSRQVKNIEDELNSAFSDFLHEGYYILGAEVRAFEKEFASYCGCDYGIGVASGTEALWLALKSLEIGPGDEVITVPNTAIPTVTAIIQSGATPKFVDIDENMLLMDCSKLEAAINPKTKAIIPVHLYGQMVNMDELMRIANAFSIPVIEDCAQAHGAKYKGKKAGSFGMIGCFSFYPTKNLGGYGDGGMIVTNNEENYNKLIMLRNYGQKNRYETDIIGFNSRLDELQAAFLRIKLKTLDEVNEKRRSIAKTYTDSLKGKTCILTGETAERYHVYHLFVLRCKNRDIVMKYCEDNGLQTLIHYPVPLHLQKAFVYLGYQKGDFPVAEKVSSEILSLPIYPELKQTEIQEVVQIIGNAFEKIKM